MNYYSEYGQDKWLHENIFKDKKYGTFVEFGALDGIKHSNTLFFEEQLGWTGLLVEANPDEYNKLIMNRQKCICVNCAISSVDGFLQFTKINGKLRGWSGISSLFESEHIDKIAQNIDSRDIHIIEIPTIPLNILLERYRYYSIDYMSIDVEGAEYEILKSFDFDRFNVEVFSIENNFGNYPIQELMESKGYELINKLTIDEIYQRRS